MDRTIRLICGGTAFGDSAVSWNAWSLGPPPAPALDNGCVIVFPEMKRTLGMPPGAFFESCFAGIRWHQRWELFPGVFTPGTVDVAELCERLQLPRDLSGKRVIDVGGYHGCMSFECERRGAAEVVCYSLENPTASGFNRMKSLLDSKVEYVQGSAYALSPELGQFDIVVFSGVLYHLRYPLLAIDKIRGICTGDVYIETHVIDDCFITREPGSNLNNAGPMPNALPDIPVWRQYQAYELHPEDASNWFGPNKRAVLEGFESAGFEIDYLGSKGDRSFFKARVQDEVPERLRNATYESRACHDAELAGIPRNIDAPLFEPTNLPRNGVPRDTRRSEGVLAKLDVDLERTRLPLGETLRGTAVAENTGSAVWLTDNAKPGAVSLAVQLFQADGTCIADHHRFPLNTDGRPILPGETVQVDFEIEATARGQWQVEFDLVSEPGPGFRFQFRTDMIRRFPVETF